MKESLRLSTLILVLSVLPFRWVTAHSDSIRVRLTPVQGDDGESCTFVVQEFVQDWDKQDAPYTATIHFSSRQACNYAIEGYLAEYYEFHVQHNEEVEDEEGEESEAVARTALESLRALLSDREEFQDDAAAKAYLYTASSKSEPRIMSKLRSWTDELYERLQIDGGQIRLTARTPLDLMEKIKPSTKTVPPSMMDEGLRCSPWPFVYSVRYVVVPLGVSQIGPHINTMRRIGLDSPLLRQGIILADLPVGSPQILSVPSSLLYM